MCIAEMLLDSLKVGYGYRQMIIRIRNNLYLNVYMYLVLAGILRLLTTSIQGFLGDKSAKQPSPVYASLFDDSMTLAIEAREPNIIGRLQIENFSTNDLLQVSVTYRQEIFQPYKLQPYELRPYKTLLPAHSSPRR